MVDDGGVILDFPSWGFVRSVISFCRSDLLIFCLRCLPCLFLLVGLRSLRCAAVPSLSVARVSMCRLPSGSSSGWVSSAVIA